MFSNISIIYNNFAVCGNQVHISYYNSDNKWQTGDSDSKTEL